ncbi:MAG: hypothetical protein JKY83_03280 [Rhizobiaceae bacterium]|nr:hypothetical protein [Rhizobiaceae bacterium]
MNIDFPRLPILRFLMFCCFVLVQAVFPTVVSADEISEHIDGIYVEDATITPAKKGGTAILRFKVTNFGQKHVTLVGLSATFAGTGSMMMNIPEIGPKSVSELTILSEETLDFSASHLKGELGEIVSDLVSGTNVEFVLTFSNFTTTAIAHVH